MSDEKVPTDWAGDVKRYVPDADDGVIAAIVRYCGIALRTRDASMVSFTQPAETDRVRENFCKKKLGLTDPDAVIDDAIAAVGKRMSDTDNPNRVTVYYLLTEHFGKLAMFGGAAAGAGAVTAAAAVAATTGAATATPTATAAPLAAAAPVAVARQPAAAPRAAAAPIPPGTRGVYQLRPVVTRPLSLTPTAGAGGGAVAAASGGDGFFGLAAAVFGGAAAVMIVAAIAGSYVAGRFDAEAEVPAPAAPAAPVAAPAPAPVIPEGAGIVSEVIDGRPKVSVFFDVGKNDIAPDFAVAVAPIKAWLDANPADRAQLSGFTDPTGDAAANAELAKRRAQAVSAELTAQGIAADRMDLVKPADSSDDAVDLSGARRVEITVTGG